MNVRYTEQSWTGRTAESLAQAGVFSQVGKLCSDTRTCVMATEAEGLQPLDEAITVMSSLWCSWRGEAKSLWEAQRTGQPDRGIKG